MEYHSELYGLGQQLFLAPEHTEESCWFGLAIGSNEFTVSLYNCSYVNLWLLQIDEQKCLPLAWQWPCAFVAATTVQLCHSCNITTTDFRFIILVLEWNLSSGGIIICNNYILIQGSPDISVLVFGIGRFKPKRQQCMKIFPLVFWDTIFIYM